MKENEYFRQLKKLRKMDPTRRIDLIGTCCRCRSEDQALMWVQPKGARVATAECSRQDRCAASIVRLAAARVSAGRRSG